MTLPYPNARVACVLAGPQGPYKYASKGSNSISDGIINTLFQKIYAALGGKIAGVLALPLLWAALRVTWQ